MNFDKNSEINKKCAINDCIAYECHVKGITMDPSSQVSCRGTYLGLKQKLEDIKNLGVNTIILMPTYEYEDTYTKVFGVPADIKVKIESGRRNYWGFETGDYLFPKRAYAKDDPEKEVKQLCDYAHKLNMQIICEFHFTEDINIQLVIDTVKKWFDIYGVDGFVLNINPWILKCLTDIRGFENIKFYVYSIDAGINYTNPDRIILINTEGRNIIRKMIRGDEDGIRDYINLLSRRKNKWSELSFVTSHNGFTLYDLYSYTRKNNEANGENNRDGENYNYGLNCGSEGPSRKRNICDLRIKFMKNAWTALMFSGFSPMLLGGDEELNSQKGNNNAYCQDNAISYIQYGHEDAEEMKRYLQSIIRIRQESKLFSNYESNRSDKNGIPYISFHGSQAWNSYVDNVTRCIGILFYRENSSLYLAINSDSICHKLALPHINDKLRWVKISDTSQYGSVDPLIINDSFINIDSNSMQVYRTEAEICQK